MLRTAAITLALAALFASSSAFVAPRGTRKAMTVSMGYVPGK